MPSKKKGDSKKASAKPSKPKNSKAAAPKPKTTKKASKTEEFVCETCGKSFKRKKELTDHKKTCRDVYAKGTVNRFTPPVGGAKKSMISYLFNKPK